MEGWNTFWFTAGGLALGWILSQLSSWWSLRGQRQRTYRRMLFFLLQMEWLHQRMDVSEWIDHFINRLHETVFDEALTANDEQILREQVSPHLAAFAIKRSGEELSVLESGYMEAIEDLSHIAPFLAFRLEGRTSIVKRLEGAQEIVGEIVKPEMGVSPEQLGLLKETLIDMQPDLLEEDLEQIRELMRSLAMRVGPFTWWKTVRGYRKRGELTQDEKDSLNELIDNYIERIQEKLAGA